MAPSVISVGMRTSFLVLLAAMACDDGRRGALDGSVSDVATDMSFDTSIDASDAADSGDADSGAPICADLVRSDVDMVLADTSETHFHASATFDGERFWLTYTTLEEGTSIFDVRLRSVGCDGSLGPELPVNAAAGESELDSAVAANDGRVLVAYQADDQSGTSGAIRPFVRVFDAESGDALTSPTQVATTREGMPVEATNWLVRVRANADGFLVGGSWGVEELSNFQVYSQALDLDGTPVGQGSDLATMAGVAQSNLVLGEQVTAWTELGDAGSRIMVLDAGSTTSISDTAEADNASVAGQLVAYDGGSGSTRSVYLHDLASGAHQQVSPAGAADALPAIAGDADGFMLIWLRNLSGLQHAVYVVSGRVVGGSFELDEPRRIETSEPVYPYPPVLVATHGEGRAYLAAWSQGAASPRFQVHGRFLR